MPGSVSFPETLPSRSRPGTPGSSSASHDARPPRVATARCTLLKKDAFSRYPSSLGAGAAHLAFLSHLGGNQHFSKLVGPIRW
jgi:hypothetical protein